MDIAILGAGICGVTTAIALAQRGYPVSIYERRVEPSHIGAGIVLWPNASFVLNELGILPDIAAVSGRPETMRRLAHGGEILGCLDITKLDEYMGFPSYSILRRDLYAVLLYELERLDVEVQYQHEATAITSAGGGKACIHFQNGLQIQPDLVIGADGRMRSIARQFVHGVNTPVYQGFINWIGILENKIDIIDEMSVSDIWGVGKRFGIVPVSKNKIYWAGGIAQETIDKTKKSSFKEELISEFSTWPGPVSDIIQQADERLINKIFVHDHDPIADWHRGNVILIGDSAHAPLPTSGQGACQAMEDAWHLVKFIEQYPDAPQTAFKKFTRLRRDKTASITYAARNFARSLFNQDKIFCQQRNEQSKQADFAIAVQGMAKAWGQGLPIGGWSRMRYD